jgi:hypothetical protein
MLILLLLTIHLKLIYMCLALWVILRIRMSLRVFLQTMFISLLFFFENSSFTLPIDNTDMLYFSTTFINFLPSNTRNISISFRNIEYFDIRQIHRLFVFYGCLTDRVEISNIMVWERGAWICNQINLDFTYKSTLYEIHAPRSLSPNIVVRNFVSDSGIATVYSHGDVLVSSVLHENWLMLNQRFGVNLELNQNLVITNYTVFNVTAKMVGVKWIHIVGRGYDVNI